MKPLISVIIPCYNTWEYLPQCLQSLESQTIGIDNLQLILVDDASTDGGKTWECITEFEKKYPESVVAIHLDENRCQGGARNVGIEYAKADYLGFIDSDDWIEPKMYKCLYQRMIKEQCDIVKARMIVELPDGKSCFQDKTTDKHIKFPMSTLEGDQHWIDAFTDSCFQDGLVTGIYRKDIIIENQIFFPEKLKYEDNYWGSILLLYIKNAVYLAKDFYHYRQNEQSTTHLKNNYHHFDRLEIEERKLEKYKELGVYERFAKEIEKEFLEMYYCNTLGMLWSRFDNPPYDIFCKIQNRVKELFPNYKLNPYFQQESVNKMFLGLIDKNLSETQFLAVGKEIMSWLDEESSQMKENKIAFITCVNNESEYAEALYYIERLSVPEGYETDVIAVREALSMAAGYNAAMKSSDAKYKVYLHQDTFIINQNFIIDMLEVFQGNSQIGMLGCVGSVELPLNAQGVIAWDVGNVYHNCNPKHLLGKRNADGRPYVVEALDGLFLATQYDIEWREELFDGWDYYDLSQCMEMMRFGYKVVVPYQQIPWCYHDNGYSKMRNYYKYCEKFVEEYQDIKPFFVAEQSEVNKEYHLLREQSIKELTQLIECEAHEELLQVFSVPENCGYLHLREFEILVAIERLERARGKGNFWKTGDSWKELRDRMANIRFALKRIEYDADQYGEKVQQLMEDCGAEAFEVINSFYCIEQEKVMSVLLRYSYNLMTGAEKMEELKKKVRQKYPIPQTPKVEIGDFTYGAPFIATEGNSTKIKVGKFCSFAKDVLILLEVDHRMEWNTTFPFNVWMEEFSDNKEHPTSKGDIIIGNDVWVATQATILSGVTIGDGAVIAANAVVTKDVPPYGIVAGNPGRVVKMRFDEVTRTRLLEMKWWDWDYEDIYNVIPILQSEQMDELYDYYMEHVKNK